VQTHPTEPNNKTDIIVNDNEEGTCLLRNVAIYGDRNVVKKVVDMVLKRKDLIIEI
jgi:hypothetical protein